MTPPTLTALRGSIVKWRAIVDGTGIDKGQSNCPLCQMFYEQDGQKKVCVGCPVMESTGQNVCQGSPYDDWCEAETNEEYSEAACAELAFLESLLPAEAKA